MADNTVEPRRGVGAAGDTLDDLDEFVQDARRAGIPGTSPVWSSTRQGFSLSTGVPAPGSEPTPRWTGPRSIKDPIFPGPGFPVEVLRDGNGWFTGRSVAGLTNLVNAHLYETTRSTDCVNWYIVDPDKAVRRLRPWLTHRQTDKPALDWVAPSWDEGCLLLLDAYKAVSERPELGPGDEWDVSDAAPAVAIYIDAQDLLRDLRKYPVPAFDGMRFTFGDLVARVARRARPEAFRVFLATPATTNSIELPADIRLQFPYRVAMRSTSYVDQMAAFNGDTTDVTLHDLPDCAFYGERYNDQRPDRVMGYRYDVEDIAWAATRHGAYAATLDQGTAAGLEHYAERWSRPDQQAFLRRVAGVQAGRGEAAG